MGHGLLTMSTILRSTGAAILRAGDTAESLLEHAAPKPIGEVMKAEACEAMHCTRNTM
jgi:hypothetical protein